uniref:Uncharacterized protein n=1 Tax=Ciona intestinalis TaxID=7719 RepID=F6TL28_CIOIN
MPSTLEINFVTPHRSRTPIILYPFILLCLRVTTLSAFCV